ncbi:hypothetical protein [Lysobacter brunescens]|uniref:Uncharacterized protein n=1 Tax=Lysobacter brunescens TaxID=262323 RepID=A0ABW2YHW9_9GAMM
MSAMPPRNNAPSSPQGDGGVRITAHAGHGRRARMLYIVLALALVGAGASIVLMKRGGSDRATTARVASDMPTEPASPAQSAPDAPIDAERVRRDPDDLANYVSPGDRAPTMNEVIDKLHEAGIRTGLGAFNPPGTSPPLIGLAVPEDFPLPEGYVRHYQATDDGQRIEPILMFSPDFDFRDASGRPIPLPDNLVVPPHLAPPGLPLRPIEIPPPSDPHDPRRGA